MKFVPLPFFTVGENPYSSFTIENGWPFTKDDIVLVPTTFHWALASSRPLTPSSLPLPPTHLWYTVDADTTVFPWLLHGDPSI